MTQHQRKIVLASNNAGKIREINALLTEHDFEILPQKDFTAEEAVEDGLSFVENAIKKARFAAAASGLPAIADDSGIEVDALDGAPGIYSARYAGENAADADNVNKLLDAMQAVGDEQRGARFQCVMVYLRHANDPTPLICQGSWEGRILRQPQGENGFGYDPVFFVPEDGCSAAELDAARKNALSHRGKALRQLADKLVESGY
ncbi:MAG: XTP/dITP diphosphatase [Chromatiales bacterium]|jgi:XTP/dITP diphosphohydrolase